MVCRLQDVRAFIGAIFDDFGEGLNRAGLAWEMVQQHLENMKPGTGVRNFGLWEDIAGTHLTDMSQQHPEIHRALLHIAHNVMQLPSVCVVRLARGQKRLGPWQNCTRSLIIWWWPKDPSVTHQIHHDGVSCALHAQIGSDWQSARVMQFIMSDEPLLAADASQDPDGVARGSASGAPEEDGETTEGGSPSALSVIPEGSESDFSAHVQQVMLAAWQEVSNTEDLTSEHEQLETDESQQLIYAAVERPRLAWVVGPTSGPSTSRRSSRGR